MEERLRRKEYEAVRCLLGAISYAAHARDDLKDRMEQIGRGNERMNDILNRLEDVTSELLGSVPEGQCRQLRNTMRDMEMRMGSKTYSDEPERADGEGQCEGADRHRDGALPWVR